MKKEPETPQDKPASNPDETPPPFNPDPDLVTFLERDPKQDPKKAWKETEPGR